MPGEDDAKVGNGIKDSPAKKVGKQKQYKFSSNSIGARLYRLGLNPLRRPGAAVMSARAAGTSARAISKGRNGPCDAQGRAKYKGDIRYCHTTDSAKLEAW
jgi:hypothetical protein